MNLLLCALAALAAPTSADEVPPFAEFGKAFLKSHFKTEDVAKAPPDDLRLKQCVHFSLGAFDVAYPIWALGDKSHQDDLRSIAGALLQVQTHWVDWIAKDDPAAQPVRADVETLSAWVKSWKSGAFSRAETAPDKDLYVLTSATPEQLVAAKRLATTMNAPTAFGAGPTTEHTVSIVFAPTRRDFVEMLGYAGLADPSRTGELWTKDTASWTSFWLGWDLVLALEYPAWGGDKEFHTGLSMNKFEATGLLEHTLLHAMLGFLWMRYGDGDWLYLNQAQAMNMVIEICGEANALEGEGGRGTTGAHTDPYEKFVPGGNPNGGFLPPIPAGPLDTMKTNQWHEGAGHDHFVAALRKGQANGRKQIAKEKPTGIDPSVAKDKNAHFVLLSPDQHRVTISAPFFGEASKKKPYPPQEVIADYKEFFRAYRTSFFWWVQTQGDKSGAAQSAAKWKTLLVKLVPGETTHTLEEVVAEVYGVPLSAKNGDVDSLEWRFLDWLAKGK